VETNRGSEGILSQELSEKREAIVELLKTAYFMELETVMNYVTNSINPDGVRAQEVKENIEEA
jgi:bacterioferritin